MTTRDMYNALLQNCRYKTDGCYPSTRYDRTYDKQESWWGPAWKDYAKFLRRIK